MARAIIARTERKIVLDRKGRKLHPRSIAAKSNGKLYAFVDGAWRQGFWSWNGFNLSRYAY